MAKSSPESARAAGGEIRVQSTPEGPVVHSLEVEVPAAQVGQAFDRAYRDLARRVKLSGFRPGKAPRSVLERRFGASLAEQISNTLVADTLAQAIERSGLEPVTEPAIDAPPPQDATVYRYRVRLEVKPEVKLPELRGLPAVRPAVEVSDADVDRELEALRLRQAPLVEEPEHTAVADGHLVSVDFVGRVDGRPFEGGSAKGVEIEVGAQRFLPGFEEQLVGARAGEDREVRVRFPEPYARPELAGREALFSVHVHEVKRRDLPELDDEFAKDLGDFETLDALRLRIRSDLTAARDREAQAVFHRTLMDALIERTPLDLPPGLVERELERQLGAAARRLEQSVSHDKLHAQLERWREEWRERAEREVREMLLLEAVARDQGISVADDEVEARIAALAEEQGVDPQVLRKAYGGDELAAALRSQMRDERALDFLGREARVEETADT